MNNNQQLTTPVVDFLATSDRFVSSSRLHGRLHRYQLLLRRWWWLVCLILLMVVAPVYLFTVQLPPAYQSKARMWLTGRLNLNEGRLYTEELVDYLSTQAELLRSSTIQQRALAKLRRDFTNDFTTAAAGGSRGNLSLVQQARKLVKDLVGQDSSTTNAPEEAFPFTLKVAEGAKSSILELRVTGTEPASTRAFLSRLMEEYFAFKKEHRQQTTDRTLASVTAEIRQLAEELKAQQEKVYAFQSSNNVVFLQEQGTSAGGYLALLNRQIATLRTQLQLLQRLQPEQWIDTESRRSASNSGDSEEAAARDTLVSLAGPRADLFRANQQMQLLKAKREELGRFLRPAHPKIIKLDEEIATQERLVNISRAETLQQLANRRQALQLELTNLQSAFGEEDVKALESSRKMADYDRMRLDLRRLEASYDRLLGVIQTVDVSKTVDQENVGVLEPASVARPIPRLVRNTALALLAALALSVAVVYCLGVFDDRFASPLELADCLSAEVLGQIPAISLKHPKGQLAPSFFERQRFEFLESFRNLRSSLLFMRNGETRPKTILITSSLPREGKSTVTLYLAATMAMANSRVLLVDGDMRRASLHKFFGAAPFPGLAEVLNGEVSPGDVIVQCGLDNLFLLPAGAARRNPGELVLSPEWSRVMAELYPHFDYILIDSPPLLATDDAASLAPTVDGVVMIVRGLFTSARQAHRGLDLLRQRQAHVLGLVFNRARSSAYEYHSYQHFQGQYRWHPQTSAAPPALAYDPAPQPGKSQVA
ncbi:MAG TPA: polysaccharide biosynthesis tyrosine autokinase [Verrucomicrobiae bacterium]